MKIPQRSVHSAINHFVNYSTKIIRHYFTNIIFDKRAFLFSQKMPNLAIKFFTVQLIIKKRDFKNSNYNVIKPKKRQIQIRAIKIIKELIDKSKPIKNQTQITSKKLH